VNGVDLSWLKTLSQFKWLRISTAILIGGFFIGFNLAFLDLANSIPFQVFTPYLTRETYFSYYFASHLGKLDYIKYTLAEAVVVLGGGVLAGLVTIGTLFILGLAIGSAIPIIVEYSGAVVISQSIAYTIFFSCSLIFLGASGLSLGASILHLAKNTGWRIDLRTYDTFLMGLLFLFLTVGVEVL
jgi:hypothetical protein